MIRKMMFTATALAALSASPVIAKPCKDAKGKFTKCPPAGVMPAMSAGVVKDAKGKCHIASGPKKGQFTKC